MCEVKKITFRIIICLCIFHMTRGAFLRCYNGSLNKYMSTPLDKAMSIWPCIDTDLPTVIYTFGYRGRVEGPATTAVLNAYIARRKKNVVLLDWEEEAKSGLLGIPLGYALYAVPNAKKIGVEMGEALIQLEAAGLNMTRTHLMGHSLGAHIMGYAGRHARAKGHVVSRITGLDPARALFEGTFAIQSGLDRTCARFVDVLHTDPGGYGTSGATATVDIWPNHAGKGEAQPGCEVGDFEMFSKEDLCNHDRAWQYFVEAISSPTSFPAVSAESHDAWIAHGRKSNKTIYMGELTSTRAKGNYYLMTNPQPPFGMGMEGLDPVVTPARKRRNSALSRLLAFLR